MPELGITINTSGVAKGVADLDTIPPAAARAEAAVTKLAQATNTQLQQSGNVASEYGRKMQEAMQRQSGSGVLGPSFDFDKMRAAIPAIEKLGRELDQLRMKYVPLAAAEAQHAQALAEIQRANALGALSAVEMAAAIDKQTAAYTRLRAQAQAASGGKGAANDPMARMNQTNMMYQFQDIAVTAAMGMSPAMIALQQGSQMAMNFQGAGGIGAGLKGMASGLLAMVQPATLLPMLIVGVGAAMYQWLTSSEKGTKTLDEAMKQHTESVKLLGEAYGSAGEKAKVLFSSGGQEFAKAMISMDIKGIKQQIDELTKTTIGGMRSETGWATSLMGAGPNVATLKEMSNGFAIFKPAIDELIEGVRAGRTELDQFGEDVERIFQRELPKAADPAALANLRDAILMLGSEALTVSGKFAPFQESINKLNLAFAEGNLTPDLLRQINDEIRLVGELNGFQEQANEAIALEKELVNLLNLLEQIRIAQFRATEAVRDHLASERMSNSEVEGFNERRERDWKREDDRIAAERQRQRARTNDERMAAARAEAEANNLVKGPDRNRAIDQAVQRERDKINQEEADALRKRTEGLDDLLSKQQLELELLGKTAGEQAALREEYQRTEEYRKFAQERGIEMDQQELDLIREKTKAYGEQVDQLNAVKLMQDLLFEQSLITMDATEASIARRLRGTGLGMDSPQAGVMRDTAAQTELRDFARGTAKDFLGSFADVLTSGGDDMGERLVEAMVGAAQRTLDKILDRLLDDIINTILFGQGGQGGGGGGLIGTFTDALLGGGGGAANSNFPSGQGVFAQMLGVGVDALTTGGTGGGGGGGGGTIAGGSVPQQVWNYFKGQGLPDFQVAAIMGHVQAESGFDPGIKGDNQQAFGLFQWNDRKNAMVGDVGPDWRTDVKGQLDFAMKELRTSESGAWNALRGSTNLREATGAFGGFERARGFSWDNPEGIHNWSGRYANARAAFGKYGGSGDRTIDDSAASVEKFDSSVKKAVESVDKVPASSAKIIESFTDLNGISGATAKSLGSLAGGMSELGKTLTSFMSSAQGGGSGWFGGLMNMFGGAGGALDFMTGISPGATMSILGAGGAFTGLYHSGNVGVSSRTSRHFASMAPWMNAPRLHNGNMFAADEYPAVLRQGEPVFPSMAAARDTMGGKTQINIHNYVGADVKTEEKKDKGHLTLEVVIDRMQASNMDQRGTATNNAMRNKFGLQERMKMR